MAADIIEHLKASA